MGTETFLLLLYFFDFFSLCVKLNNPLMGTETSLCSDRQYSFVFDTVKLNNPLMGVETRHTHGHG